MTFSIIMFVFRWVLSRIFCRLIFNNRQSCPANVFRCGSVSNAVRNVTFDMNRLLYTCSGKNLIWQTPFCFDVNIGFTVLPCSFNSFSCFFLKLYSDSKITRAFFYLYKILLWTSCQHNFLQPEFPLNLLLANFMSWNVHWPVLNQRLEYVTC